MSVTIGEALYLMKELKVKTVEVDELIRVFLQPTPEKQEEEEVQELPEIAEAPTPPKEEGEVTELYPNYQAARKAAGKGQKPVKDEALGGWVIV